MMISTAVNVTTLSRLDCAHRIAPRMPPVSVATHGILKRGLTYDSAFEIGFGHAMSRPLAYVTRANWSVIANDALKIARIAPQVTMSTAVCPNEDRTTSVTGVEECRNAGRSAVPSRTPMNGMTSKTIPI